MFGVYVRQSLSAHCVSPTHGNGPIVSSAASSSVLSSTMRGQRRGSPATGSGHCGTATAGPVAVGSLSQHSNTSKMTAVC